MAELTANGAQLAFDDRGEGSPAFLFVHGWACDRSGWDAQIENLSRDHRCVAVDLRGKWLSASREVRIVTNLCVYWDEVFLTSVLAPASTVITRVAVTCG